MNSTILDNPRQSASGTGQAYIMGTLGEMGTGYVFLKTRIGKRERERG
jgi:hypothetical protein